MGVGGWGLGVGVTLGARAGKPELRGFVSIRVHSWFKTARGDYPLRVRPSVGPGTRGLPSAARPPKPNTEPCVFTSRRQVSPTACKAQAPVPQTPDVPKARNRSRAGKPELHQFVLIRVHSWFNTALGDCPLRVRPSVGPGTRGLPSAARPPKPNTEPCVFTSRRQVSPTACKAQAPVPQTPDVPNARDRSRAGKPELHPFVSIRVHSWFKTGPAFVSIRGLKHPPHSCPFVV